MNDLVPQIEAPQDESEDDHVTWEDLSPEERTSAIQAQQELFEVIRHDRPDFDAMLKAYDSRLYFLRACNLDPEDDDVLALMQDEINRFVGLGRYASKKRPWEDDTSPTNLSIEEKRITELVELQKTARSNHRDIILEMGYRLNRVKEMFDKRDRLFAWAVKDAFEVSHMLREIQAIIISSPGCTYEHFLAWEAQKHNVRPETTHALLTATQPYNKDTPIDTIDIETQWGIVEA